ncbi:MAG: hypothetical protein AAF677_01245 [Pseudomonadota bacterium]
MAVFSNLDGLVDVTAISLGAVLGSLIGSLITLAIRRWLTKLDAAEAREASKKEFALSLHVRFNSAEVLKARAEAEKLMVRNTGKHLYDLKADKDTDLGAFWMVAREYEFLGIAIEEEIADEEIIAKYFGEIFSYWNLHFRTAYAGTGFSILQRLDSLEKFFKKHHTAETLEKFRRSSIGEINRLRGEADLPEFDFDKA